LTDDKLRFSLRMLVKHFGSRFFSEIGLILTVGSAVLGGADLTAGAMAHMREFPFSCGTHLLIIDQHIRLAVDIF
jgi:hypothetical protein